MSKLIICFGIISAIVLRAWGNGDIGPGRWSIVNVQTCDDNEKYEHTFTVSKRRVSRHKIAFSANISLAKDMDDKFGIKVDISKLVDGGYKLYQVMGDDSFVEFINKYAKDNAAAALTKAGVDPPEVESLVKGNYQVTDFEMDMCEMPREAIKGEFICHAYLLYDKAKVGCIQCTVEFKKLDEIENDECE